MDKVVDHLLVFKGNAEIEDFPGNYTQYRSMPKEEEAVVKSRDAAPVSSAATRGADRKAKLSFKEKQELKQLEADIATLEAEKQQIEEALCSGTLSVADLTEKSKRLPLLTEELDLKMMRWLELSEVEG